MKINKKQWKGIREDVINKVLNGEARWLNKRNTEYWLNYLNSASDTELIKFVRRAWNTTNEKSWLMVECPFCHYKHHEYIFGLVIVKCKKCGKPINKN